MKQAFPNHVRVPQQEKAQGNLPGEHVLDRSLVQDAVRELNRIYTRSALETAVRVGNYVIDKFFGGDPLTFRRSSRDHVSFRALARLGSLRFSSTFLWSSVAVVEQLQQLPKDVAYQIPLSHHRILLGVGDHRTKVALANRAALEDLSKRQLEELVVTSSAIQNQRQSNRLGRPRKPKAVKILSAFLRSVQSTLALKTTQLHLEDRSIDAGLALLDEIQRELEVLRDVLPQMRKTMLQQEDPSNTR